MITQYKTIHGREKKLHLRVNAAIAEGWQPFGGVTSYEIGERGSYKIYFCQSMVKYIAPRKITVTRTTH